MKRISLLGLSVAVCFFVSIGQSQYIEDSIDVGGAWVGSLVYNSREDVIYGGCQTAGIFFAISCDSNKVVASYPLTWPRRVAYDSIDNKVYCAFKGGEGDSLAVIDGSSHQVVKKLGMPGATMPVWDPVGDRVYVSCQNAVRVAVVDCRTDSLLTYIDVGWTPIKMYLNTLRRKLYVLNYDAGTVSVIDLATNQVISTVEVGGFPNAGYYCRRVDKFYCSSPPGSVAVMDGRDDSVVARIPLPDNGEALSMTGNELTTTVVFGVFSDVGNDAYFVSAPNDSVVSVLPVGREPWGTLFSSTTGLVYSANTGSNTVTVMAGDGSRVLKTIPVGADPFVFHALPRHERAYLGHLGSSKVYVIRDSVTGISEDPAAKRLPPATAAGAPNPFRRSLVIRGCSPDRHVRVYSSSGRLVKVLSASRALGSEHSVLWNGCDSDGRPVPPGVYLLDCGIRGPIKAVKAE